MALVELKNVVKTFTGVTALSDVNFSLEKGEVHILLGENGAGKSTLMKILSGVYQPDQGEIFIEGEKHIFKRPIDARRAGIATIYQELNLVEYLSVAENLHMGRLPTKGNRKTAVVDWKKIYGDSGKILNNLHVDIDPKERVSHLGSRKNRWWKSPRHCRLAPRS
jgi:ABC-type sugar transport system ATPase subunit